MKENNNKKFGFTFVEVMLALVIIGMIYLIAVPSLQRSTKGREKTSQLMKIYPVLDNLINLIVLEHMKPESVPFGTKDDVGNDKFAQLLVKRLRVGEDCQNTSTSGEGCWPKKTFDNTNFNTDTNYYKMRLVDGTSLAINSFPKCGGKKTVDGKTFEDVCAVIYVDVNSFEPPNEWGEDVFCFVYTNDKGLQAASKAAIEVIEKPKEATKKED